MINRPNTTPVPDELFDEWLPQLSPAELRVILYITRKTLGYRKDRDCISLNQIADGVTKKNGQVIDRGTGLSRSAIKEAINSLEYKGLIKTEKNFGERGNHPTSYWLNIAEEEDDNATYPRPVQRPSPSPAERPRLGQPNGLPLGQPTGPTRNNITTNNLQDTSVGSKTEFSEERRETQSPNPDTESVEAECKIADSKTAFPNGNVPSVNLPMGSIGRYPAQQDDIDLSSPIEDFAKAAYGKNKKAKIEKLTTNRALALGGIVQKLEREEKAFGRLAFRRALIRFLDTEDDWLRRKRWPIYAFLKSPSKYLDDQDRIPKAIPTHLNRDQQARQEIPVSTGGPGNGSIHGHPSANGGVSELPPFCLLWNQIVTSGGPVKRWRPDKDPQIPTDKDFTENQDEILRKCQAILLKQGEGTKWITCRSLIEKHWYKVLNGEYDWKLAEDTKPKGNDRNSRGEETIRKAKELIEKQYGKGSQPHGN